MGLDPNLIGPSRRISDSRSYTQLTKVTVWLQAALSYAKFKKNMYNADFEVSVSCHKFRLKERKVLYCIYSV